MRVVLVTALAGALLGPVAERAAAAPYIHAHRGGSIVDGVPAYPENTMPAFRHAARHDFVLEFDVKLTADGVPVVIHDADLDRVTDCTGLVADKTLAEIRACHVDILGTEGNFVQLDAGDPRMSRVPKLARVLRFVKRTGARANIEIKNVPTDADFDSSDSFATTVINVITASAVPPSHLVIQSFWPPNLDVAAQQLPGVELSLLTLAQMNDGGPAFAQARDYRWVSPAWPVDPGYVEQAHGLGREIVPYTIDDEEGIAAADEAGVDAIITNDPMLARRVVRKSEPDRVRMPPPPSPADCEATRASTHLPPIRAYDPQPGAPRIFAMQFKQDVANVATYATYRTKIECMIREYVVPHLAEDRPNLVLFNEDVGLMTLATGSRGQAARDIFADPDSAPSCEQQGVPCGALGALEAVTAAYSPQVAAYNARFPGIGPIEQSFVAPTDTLVRGWMQTFSDMARRYGIYIGGSNTQAKFRESRDPSEIALFADPDQPTPDSVYVATGPRIYNTAFLWGPRYVTRDGPRPLWNAVAANDKVPVTPLEAQLQVSNGPNSGPDAVENVRPYEIPGTQARVQFATSLPAFEYGNEFDEPAPDVDPCSDMTLYYMRCLDKLGVNVVLQDEANASRWPATGGQGAWQPLEWMGSTWRAASDPTVDFAYNVTPFLVGNLADVVFDGQTSITQRGGARGRGCNYIGDGHFRPAPPESDQERFRSYAGPKREFLAITPWVDRGGGRKHLRKVGAKLAPGSGDELENDYVETAVIADLPFPVDTTRSGCAGVRKR